MAPSNLTYRPYDHERDNEAAAACIAHAFGTPIDLCSKWLGMLKDEFRVATLGDTLAGTVVLYDAGQFFGSKSVRMLAVAGVTVTAEARGKGVAKEMMRRCVLEMHEMGAPLTSLYPATQPLYRGVGYQVSGWIYEHRIPTGDFAPRPGDTPGDERALDMRPVTENDHPRIKEIYSDFARGLDGYIDRDRIFWHRVFLPQAEPTDSFCAYDPATGEIEGYVVFKRRSGGGDPGTQLVMDVAFSTPRAGRRLCVFLSSHSSTIKDIHIRGGAYHPLQMLLTEQRYEWLKRDYWMNRVLDVPSAIEGRGYTKGLRTRAEIAITDPIIEANTGNWTIETDGSGGASCTKGGSGMVMLDIRDLAPLYSGLFDARTLRTLGRLSGPDDQLDALSAMFAGRGPAVCDQY